MASRETQDGKSAYPLRAVDRVCDILDILANSPSGSTLTEVAEEADLPKSSVFRYLAALEARHYVARDDEDGFYRLGLAFRPQDTRSLDRLLQIGRPEIDRLRDRLKETTNIGVLDGSSILHIAVAESPHMMRLAARVDERGYVHSTALGKAICATLPESRVRSILSTSGMPGFTEFTITDPDAYLAELEKVREQGYGIDDAENQLSGRCVAVAIPNIGIPAGLSVSAPSDRMSPEQIEETVAELLRATKRIGQQMKAGGHVQAR